MLVIIRSTLFIIGFFITILVYGLITLIIYPLPPLLRHRIILNWCWVILHWLRISCGIRHQVIGLENLKKSASPNVILSKHQSPWETFYLQLLFFPVSTLLKKELLDIPFFGWGLRYFRPIGIDRTNPRKALKQVKEGGLKSLDEGRNLLLFPEGTRVIPGERIKYARSGPDIAIRAGVDVIPIAQNSGSFWIKDSFLKYPGLVTVVIGEPITTKDKTSREVIEEVEQWIEGEMLKLESNKGEDQ